MLHCLRAEARRFPYRHVLDFLIALKVRVVGNCVRGLLFASIYFNRCNLNNQLFTTIVSPTELWQAGIRQRMIGIVMWGKIVAASNKLNIITSYKFSVEMYLPSEQLVFSMKNMITVAKWIAMDRVKEIIMRLAW